MPGILPPPVHAAIITHPWSGRPVVKPFGAPSSILPFLQEHRSHGGTVVLTNGVFDLLHRGHVTYLREARSRGDALVVALNSDDSVRRLKGPQRPIVPLAERAETLLALACVDAVTSFEEDTPLEVVRLLRPDVLVKGGDWSVDRIVGGDLVRSWGGRVESLPLLPGRSTTDLVERVRERYGPP
jgi:D-beta-D-heptose 7-phosphate kinase/D-beta-D-heptose 1-phosphate adenosyltransferase